MTDRELLEAAAKAAGIEYHAYVDDQIFGTGINIGEIDVQLWNPLLDDAQALRLFITLHLRIEIKQTNESPARGIVYVGRSGDDEDDLAAEPWHEGGPFCDGATRRAIVRAAAEIGGKG